MSYPGGATWPLTEWLIDGVWTDMSTRIRGDVQITGRGRANEQGSATPATASVLMDNADFELANRNPNSTLFRKIPAGTQVRHRAGDGDNHLFCRFNDIDDDGDDTCATAGDKAAFDIVGDLEVRVDCRPHTWRPAAGPMVLAKKYTLTGDQRSWVLYLGTSGKVSFAWTTSGATATLVVAESTTAIPVASGRLSIKATIDVNNGAGGNTVAFYTATSVSGVYTQLGTSVITAGVTSIYSSSAALTVGGGPDVFTEGTVFGGRCYAMHLYSGIAGSRVADPDFTLWGIDDTTKADPAGNTWTVTGQARISTPRLRFWGQLQAAEHVEDSSGNDVTVNVQAADLLQSLGGAVVPVQSPLAANFNGRTGLLGLWLGEDYEGAAVAANTVPGGKPGQPTDVTFGVTSDFPGVARTMTLPNTASKMRYVPAATTVDGFWEVVVMFKVSSLPAAGSTLFSIGTLGNTRTVKFLTNTTQFGLQFLDAAGTVLNSIATAFGGTLTVIDKWMCVRINLLENGTNADYQVAWFEQGDPTAWGISGTYADGPGFVRGVTVVTVAAGAATEYNGMGLSAVAVSEIELGFAGGLAVTDPSWGSVINGHAGEDTVTRMARIAELSGIYLEISGRAASSALLGAQPIVTPLNVLVDAAKADGGILYGLRDRLGLGYRTRQDLERHIDAYLNYTTSLSAVPQVLDDGQHLVNDVTITRQGGSSARAQIVDGYTSVSDPPDGVGPRPGGDNLNVYSDDVLPDVANLRARYGSFDAPWIPNLAVAFHERDPYDTLPTSTTGLELAHVDVGATVAVDGWPTQLPPDRLLFLVQGYQESLGRYLWGMTMNTTPAGPYQTGMWSVAEQVGGKTRYGTGTRADGTHESTLNAGITTTATTIVVAAAAAAVSTRVVWTSVAGRYPLDIMVDGEQITLGTPPTGSTSPQTFNNVTRSVNGIVRAHLAGVKVDLYNPVFYGLGI